MPAIEVEGLERAFDEVLARAGHRPRGRRGRDLRASSGPNGAGKTTTVRMLTTLLLPDRRQRHASPATTWSPRPGAVRALDRRRAAGGGARPADDRPRADPPAGDAARACPAPRASAAPTTLLERVDLVDAADRRVGTYSGGMRRRLDLAAALVHEPRVLFLDEPTTGLDPVSRKTIWEEVRALNDEGTTVFLTTQYLEEADQLADRVGIIDGGRIVAEGTPDVAEGRGRPPAPRARSWPRARSPRREEVCARFGKPLPREGRQDGPGRGRGRRRRRRAASCGRSTRPGSRSSRWSWSSRPSTTSSSPRPATTSRRTTRRRAEPEPVEA